MPDRYITETGVELAKVGTWNTYKGDGNLTPADLADIAEAAKDDEIRSALGGDPVGWLGHVDGDDAQMARQSQPAIGRITNVRVSDDGATLLGDLVNVPERVAKLYPRRSVEMKANVRTAGGKTYRRVLSGLAYLGKTVPAIGGLRDLDAFMDGAVLAAQGETVLMALAEDDTPDRAPAADALPTDPADRTLEDVTDPATPSQTEQEQPVPESTATPPVEPVAPETTPAATTEPETPVAVAEPAKDEPAGPPTVEVTQAKWDEMQAQLAEMQADREARLASERVSERDTLIAAAKGEGKLTATDLADTVEFADKFGNEALTAFLTKLPKGTVPVGELGTNASDDDVNAAAGEDADWSHLTPEQAELRGYNVQKGA